MTREQRLELHAAIDTLRTVQMAQGSMDLAARFHEAIEGMKLILDADMERTRRIFRADVPS